MEHILDKEKMDAIRALADVSMKISEAKGLLFKLQETETSYLEAREKKAMERIQKVVDESQLLLNEASSHYSEIVDLGRSAGDFSQSLVVLHSLFQDALSGFEERNVEWERKIGKQQDDLIEMRKGIKVEKNLFENDKKSLERAKVVAKEEEQKIRDKWAEINRAITRLKEGRI